MKLKVLILSLMLSIVVLETDSCTSTTRWKLRHVDVEHKETIVNREMTTKTIETDIKPNNIKNMSRIQQFITEPIVLEHGEVSQRCEKEFEEIYCHNHGKCLVIKIPGSSNERAQCICDKGYADSRCMTKLPDGEYKILKNRFEINLQSSSETTTMTEEIGRTRSTTDRDIANEKSIGNKLLCPEPYDQDFCINGQCFVIAEFIGSYFCECNNGFTGMRCEFKTPDHLYQTTRIRRQTKDPKKRKNKRNHKFRQLT